MSRSVRPLPLREKERVRGQDLGKGLGDIIQYIYIVEFLGKVKKWVVPTHTVFIFIQIALTTYSTLYIIWNY